MATRKWVIDPTHSEVQFKVKHLMITTVTGSFDKFEASIETDKEDFSKAKISFSADVASVLTGNTDRDNHLKSPDFFDVEKFPKITFVATKYESVDNDGSYELFGDLTIHGGTKKVELAVEFGGVAKDPWGNVKAGFTINGKINRKDFGLVWNAPTEAGGVLVSEDVRIACEIQLIEQQ
ncbi:MAG TPA: YceI family protein [Ferruginibacter sp.]|nr:YceI family protein [Ferruginibacter sp.]